MSAKTMNASHDYAAAYGKAHPDVFWVLSPYGVWVENPFYAASPVGEGDAYNALLCDESDF